MSARTAQEVLQLCQIDIYQGLLDTIVHDTSKNFASTKFRQNAKSLAIDVKEVFIEAHNSVEKVERYHTPLQRCYKILQNELGTDIVQDTLLQIAVKAVNDSARLDKIILMLLVFGLYLQIRKTDLLAPLIALQAKAIQEAMKKV